MSQEHKRAGAEAMQDKSLLFHEDESDVAIALIDATGSTVATKFGAGTVFDEQLAVLKTLKHKRFYVRFWNSPRASDKFVDGTYALPFAVEKDKLDGPFSLVRNDINNGCLTFPHVAFEKLPPAWLKNNSTTVYFVTDGQIGYSDIPARELAELKDKFRTIVGTLGPSVRLCILTVEAEARDYAEVNALQGAAGCDVYRLIAESKLTGMITKFVSHTPAGDFVHINKNRPPVGFVPYKEKHFSELRTAEFIQFVAQELAGCEQDELKQLQVAQNLSSTLCYLVKDKPKPVADGIVRTFANLFPGDSQMIHFVLTEAVARERAGTAGVLADYRAQMKNLFAQADTLLRENVRTAVNMTEQFVGHPINGRILTGAARLVDKSLNIHGVRYVNCAHNKVPCFPMDSHAGEMNEQCLRQWVRGVYSAVYKVNPLADDIIYLVLATMLVVVRSPKLPETVKTAYRKLATVMLKKKRLNTNETELARLERGDAPIPNSGRIEDLYAYLQSAADKIGIVTSNNKPLALWLEICQALSPKLADAQRKHCTDVGGGDSKMTLPTYEHDAIPDVAGLDYTCIITLDDLAETGGYRFLEHKSPAGRSCVPQCLVSKSGLETLLTSRNALCPMCYAPVNRDTFAAVGKRIQFVLPDSYDNQLFDGLDAPLPPAYGRQRKKQRGAGDEKQQDVNNNDNKGTLVILKGTVGCGKTTLAAKIKGMVEARGGTAYVEGCDKYCKNGTSMRQACESVSQALRKAVASSAKDLVVVIDTCGEQTSKEQFSVFNVNFAGWKKVEIYANLDTNNVKGYLSWSLWNVLRRNRPGPKDDFNLNPVTAGSQVCIDVHKKKSTALGWGKHWNFDKATPDSLRSAAEQYLATLKDPVFEF